MKDIKWILKHKKEDISLEQLGNHIRLEEDYRKEEYTKDQFTHEKIDIVEDGKSNKSNDNMDIDDEKVHDNNGNGQIKRKRGGCFQYDKSGYFKSECRFLKKMNKEKNSSAQNDHLVA